MKRTIRNRKTPLVAVAKLCALTLALSWSVQCATAADKWITFAPAGTSPASVQGEPYLADSLFGRLMGARSAPVAMPNVTEPFVAPRPSSTERRPAKRFFFDLNGYAPREREPFEFISFDAISLPTPLRSAVRFGWWQVARDGAVSKVGEYQDLDSSPFWDINQLRSDGRQTLDLYGTGLDNESSNAGLYFYTPKHTADVRYQRFLHRLDHDPLTNIPPPSSGAEIVSQDLNIGEDYAVRIQDFKTSFRGKFSKDIKYRLNVWLRRKQGERQAMGTQHGAPGWTDCTTCHVVTQRQTIDWTTASIEPIIETHVGPVKIQYSRPMRSFNQNDGIVTRSYGNFHGYDYVGDFPYAVVPDTISQTDRLRLSFNLPADSSIYTQIYRGDTLNQVRDTRRTFDGFDVRLANTYYRKVTINAFARAGRQSNQWPSFLVPPEGDAVTVSTAIIPPYGLKQPIDYTRAAAGASLRWRPFLNRAFAHGLTFNVGGEYGMTRRSYAQYSVQSPPSIIDQDETPYISYSAGTTMKWHPRFDTFVRYNGRAISNPLFAVNLYSGETNTNLPEREDLVRFGGTWVAADNLIASASVGIENRENRSTVANFVEDSYPMNFTLWYSPRPAWSISAGYGYYSNWIDQDIYFPSDDPLTAPLDRRQWNYGGRAEVLNLTNSYQWSKSITLTAALQYVWTLDAFDPLAPWPDLPSYSMVAVDKTRYSGGVDWYANERISAYMRYIYEEYEDRQLAYLSGSAHMFLGGVTAYY